MSACRRLRTYFAPIGWIDRPATTRPTCVKALSGSPMCRHLRDAAPRGSTTLIQSAAGTSALEWAELQEASNEQRRWSAGHQHGRAVVGAAIPRPETVHRVRALSRGRRELFVPE